MNENDKRIFIVHGKDNTLKEAVARFVSEMNYNPIILHEQSNKGKTPIEKIVHFGDVKYAIILLTPDDKITIKDKKISRARQNVVFEFGYFIGRLGRDKVCAIKKEPVEFQSDVNGIVYISEKEWKVKLAKEMKDAGLDVDLNKINI